MRIGRDQVAIPLVLLVIAATLAVFGPVWETSQRAPEGTARAYLAAVARGDLEGALETLAPDARGAARERVALQLGNRYRIETLVLGRPSVLDRLLARPVPPAWATVTGEVTTTDGQRWKSTSTAELVQVDGAWYLTRPLFA
jgi:hypothetical protein